MQKIISQVTERNFDHENGSLDFSCDKIELSILKGQRYEGSFHIRSAPGLFTEGTVISSDWRMECLNGEFIGGDEEILFCFHGETSEEGDVVKGDFHVISNQGEYRLPFEVSVERSVLDSSIGGIENLSHFANLARNSWQEAVRLFYSPGFAGLFSGADAGYEEIYRALSAHLGLEQNVEEFLIQADKKQKTEFMIQEEQLSVELAAFEAASAVTERELTIVRNGWGFTQLFVECAGDFLFTEKEVLTDDDFLGNHCRLPVFIDSSFCRRGRNYGQVRLYNSYVTLTVPVTVRLGEGTLRNNQELTRKRCTVQLMEFYQAFRTRKIGTATWLKETGKLVDQLVAMNEKDISARLFQAQLLITEERYNEAGWILDHVSDLFERKRAEDTLLAYYLYLTTLVHADARYIRQVTADVEHIYRQENSNWRVAWLLLYLSEDYQKSATGKWVFLEKQFRAGCCSPVLYIEAVTLLNNNPALLRKLGRFEQQVLYYGARQELLKQETVEQLLYLAGKVKEYSRVLYKTLERLYRRTQDTRLLQEICALLIKGGKTGHQYFDWYRAGVSAQLRITNLYEYFMMSVDPDKSPEIPKIVLMYFSYRNNMDYARSAYLYDYILCNRDRLGDVYETYRFKIEHFVTDQIQKGHINRHLADLYNRLLQPEMVNEQTVEPLSRLLFAHLIQVKDDRLQKVYVYQPGNLRPSEYVLWEGRTWVSLYGSDSIIVFEDAWKNRFVGSVEYTVEKLMAWEKFLGWVLPLVDSNLQLDLYLCGAETGREASGSGAETGREAPGRSIQRALRVADSEFMDSRVKRTLYLRILKYFYDTDDMGALDEYLEKIPPEELTGQERCIVIKYMALRGKYDLAGKWLETYGPYFVDAGTLLRLVGPLLEKNSGQEDSLLSAAAAYVFRKGKYDGTVLEYLAQYHPGTTGELRDIWKAAVSFGMDCSRLTERLLLQMLYTGVFVDEKMEIFRHYIACGARPEVEEEFLAECAHDYFVEGCETDREAFLGIKRLYLRGEPVRKICRLAYLKYCAENGREQDVWDSDMVETFLSEMMAEGIRLECFKAFPECEAAWQELADKTIVEYRAASRSKVRIHYTILRENGESDEYPAQYMGEAYGGVFFKEFILFADEDVQYYITEEKDGEELLMHSGTLRTGDFGKKEESGRYGMLNDIVTAKKLRDFGAMDDLLEEYCKKDFLNSSLFDLK